MGMTIEEIEAKLDKSNIDSDTLIELTRYLEKYQKIEDIYYHQTGQALENSLRAVIEDGKID